MDYALYHLRGYNWHTLIERKNAPASPLVRDETGASVWGCDTGDMLGPMSLIEKAKQFLKADACYDRRADHTFRVFASPDAHPTVLWWCDYCGDGFTREPTNAETSMVPGESP